MESRHLCLSLSFTHFTNAYWVGGVLSTVPVLGNEAKNDKVPAFNKLCSSWAGNQSIIWGCDISRYNYVQSTRATSRKNEQYGAVGGEKRRIF